MATVQSAGVVKTGTGQRGPWTLYEAVLDDGSKARGFEYVTAGDQVEVTAVQNGQYTNYNYKKSTGAAPAPAAQPAAQPAYQAPAVAPAPAPAGGTDPRAVKLLVLIATQVGIDTNQINDVLEGRA